MSKNFSPKLWAEYVADYKERERVSLSWHMPLREFEGPCAMHCAFVCNRTADQRGDTFYVWWDDHTGKSPFDAAMDYHAARPVPAPGGGFVIFTSIGYALLFDREVAIYTADRMEQLSLRGDFYWRKRI